MHELFTSLNSKNLIGLSNKSLAYSLEEHKRPSSPVLATANFDKHFPSNLHPKWPKMGQNRTNVTRKVIKCVGSSNPLR